MHSYWTFIALDIANERTREADRYRLAALARGAQPVRDRSVRHGVAVVAAAISRFSAAVVRRLDECVADDLADSFVQGASSAP
jgi:hypothetical protein